MHIALKTAKVKILDYAIETRPTYSNGQFTVNYEIIWGGGGNLHFKALLLSIVTINYGERGSQAMGDVPPLLPLHMQVI